MSQKTTNPSKPVNTALQSAIKPVTRSAINHFAALPANAPQPSGSNDKTVPAVRHAGQTKHIKLIDPEVVNWRKKKRLLAFLLNKTSQNYVKLRLQRKRIFLDDSFTGKIKKYRLAKKRLARNLKLEFLNKIKTSVEPEP